MRVERRVSAGVLAAGLLGGLTLVGASGQLHAAQAEEPVPEITPPRSAGLSEGPSPHDFVELEVREAELVLTNTSDRAINAWSVKTVVRSSQGYEAYSTFGVDAYRSPMFPGGQEKLLQPGESITIDKGEEPWIREDHRGPGSGVFYEVGALTFEGGESVGDAEIVDRIFESRLQQAKAALKALQVTSSAKVGESEVLANLPKQYRSNLDFYSSSTQAVRAIYHQAREDYRVAIENLRPEDLDRLSSLEEVVQ